VVGGDVTEKNARDEEAITKEVSTLSDASASAEGGAAIVDRAGNKGSSGGGGGGGSNGDGSSEADDGSDGSNGSGGGGGSGDGGGGHGGDDTLPKGTAAIGADTGTGAGAGLGAADGGDASPLESHTSSLPPPAPPAPAPTPPRPPMPPPGSTLEEEIAFHYGEAAFAGYTYNLNPIPQTL
jgi:hypothetical protein